MEKRKELSNDVKERIIQMLIEGKTQMQVAAIMKCSQGMISNLWAKYRRTGKIQNDPRSGRPRATSIKQDRYLIKICRKMRKSTSKQINIEWTKSSGSNVCDRTVRNRLNQHGYRFRKAKTKPLLTKKHRLQRLRWAKQHKRWTKEDWNKVIFSDESKICVGSGDDAGRFVWRLPTEKFQENCLRSSTKFPQSLIIWGCMSSKGTGRICLLKTTVNTDVYCEILDHFLLPTIEDHFPDEDIIFQDDNARCHRGRAIKSYLDTINVKSLPWPPQSPDLNPIENLWRELKKYVDLKSPTTKAELKIAIERSWTEIDINFCNNLVASMPERIKAVITARGGATKY